MPKEALDYIKSIPEFDADIFEKITGIDVEHEDEIVELTLEEVAKLKGVPVDKLRIKD